MPREVVVQKGAMTARVVKFDDDSIDDIESERVIAKRTAEELEWLRFQLRWAKWKKQFDFRPPDPTRLHAEVWG